MSGAEVRIATGSRLHLGMFGFGRPGERQFGGVGLMVAEPRLELRLSRAEQFAVTGVAADGEAVERVRRVARLWAASHQRDVSRAGREVAVGVCGADGMPCCAIAVNAAPPPHVGLGYGTQLALAVVTALDRLLLQIERPLEQRAAWAERGKRSAVGVHGFAQGGMIVDGGKVEPAALGSCEARVELPEAWRWLLVVPLAAGGMEGEVERSAFEQLPAVPTELTRQLTALAREELLPAARDADVARFGSGITRFNRLAGGCFAAYQGGAYSSPTIAARVERLLALGAAGAGQTSWGPTVFGLWGDEASAQAAAARLEGNALTRGCRVWVVASRREGARWE